MLTCTDVVYFKQKGAYFQTQTPGVSARQLKSSDFLKVHELLVQREFVRFSLYNLT